MKVATEIWIATALLHRENSTQVDFAVGEIVNRALAENLAGGYRPGLHIHASTHCVANKPPNPARHRMLLETARGRRRLFKDGDPYHPYREGGKLHPEREEMPGKYAKLLGWYDSTYSSPKRRKAGE